MTEAMPKQMLKDFRTEYLNQADLTAWMRYWESQFPQIFRLTALIVTPNGHPMWLATVGRDPDRDRPTVWVDANMHASELCGGAVALGLIDALIRYHSGADETSTTQAARDVLMQLGLSPELQCALDDVRFFIVPRMSPDGVEAVLERGVYVRSTPRDRRPNLVRPYWRQVDLDGDRQVRLMRLEHPAGGFVESLKTPGVMLPRELEDRGPYFHLFPEGMIENFDGQTWPTGSYLSDHDTDLNRNFPYSWMPASTQAGAGDYPLSEPESRAVVEFTARHPEIFLWVNLHTFGGVFIRPIGFDTDAKMNPSDLALFQELGEWAEQRTGYPMVNGFEEFLYEPGKSLKGDLTDYAYHQRGAIAFVCELWDFFAQTGLPKHSPKKLIKKFSDRYVAWGREDIEELAVWDRAQNSGKIFGSWKAFDHPQLGRVELGGFGGLYGIWNPPASQLPSVIDQQVGLYLKMACIGPRMAWGRTKVTALDPAQNVASVEQEVFNQGYLPTSILASSLVHEWNEPLLIEAIPEPGLEVIGQARLTVGHLSGYGQGKYHGQASALFPESTQANQHKRLEWRVRGKGELSLRLRGVRIGEMVLKVQV